MMSSFGEEVSNNEVKKIMDELDADGSGEIEFDEWYQYMSKRESDDYQELFEFFDKNKDGLLSR